MKNHFPRIRLWYVFALVATTTALVWGWPRLGIAVFRHPALGSKVDISWEGRRLRRFAGRQSCVIYPQDETVRRPRVDFG